MLLADLRKSASGSTEQSPDPADQATAQPTTGFSSDIKGILLVILFIATIATTGGWIHCRLQCAEVTPPQHVVPELYPWCPPQRPGCVH